MTYWRETASQQAQDQLDELLGMGLLQAEGMVRKHGEFYPFAAVWATGAAEPETLMVADELEHDGPADSQLMIDRTLTVLTGRRAEFDAAAVVTDVFINGAPAISVALEHREGISFAVVRHYRPKKLGRGGKLGALGGHLTEPVIWPAAPAA